MFKAVYTVTLILATAMPVEALELQQPRQDDGIAVAPTLERIPDKVIALGGIPSMVTPVLTLTPAVPTEGLTQADWKELPVPITPSDIAAAVSNPATPVHHQVNWKKVRHVIHNVTRTSLLIAGMCLGAMASGMAMGSYYGYGPYGYGYPGFAPYGYYNSYSPIYTSSYNSYTPNLGFSDGVNYGNPTVCHSYGYNNPVY